MKNSIWKYYIWLVAVLILNVGFRLGSAYGLANLWKMEFDFNLVWGVLPVMDFAEKNTPLFTKMSSYSLVIPGILFLVLFFISLIKDVKSQNENKKMELSPRTDVMYFGGVIAFFQYALALFLNQRIQFSHDWRGILVVGGCLAITTFAFYKYKTKKD